jgi:SAM-dependent methyltransferase
MAYLLNTDIETKILRTVHGKVARIGGAVHQIMRYDKQVKVTDVNVIDGGYGYVKRLRDIRSLRNLLGTIKRFGTQEIKHFIHGDKIALDRRTIILDMHDAIKHPELKDRFDASISSNVVEHSPNPIAFLLNCYHITKKGGWQYHAIPHYKYTFDMYRKPTPIAHFIEDFIKKTPLTDTTHVEDYTQSAIVKHGWQRRLHSAYPVAYPFMHHHVYDEFITRELAELMFEDVTSDIFKTEAHSDNVVIFKNTLNPKFLAKYKDIIESYSPELIKK